MSRMNLSEMIVGLSSDAMWCDIYDAGMSVDSDVVCQALMYEPINELTRVHSSAIRGICSTECALGVDALVGLRSAQECHVFVTKPICAITVDVGLKSSKVGAIGCTLESSARSPATLNAVLGDE